MCRFGLWGYECDRNKIALYGSICAEMTALSVVVVVVRTIVIKNKGGKEDIRMLQFSAIYWLLVLLYRLVNALFNLVVTLESVVCVALCPQGIVSKLG